MTQLEILTEPNLVLHQKCKKVKKIDNKLKKLAQEMADYVLSDKNTIGLSANQVGEPTRISVIEYDPKRLLSEEEQKKSKQKAIPLTILINPKITWRSSEMENSEEGCLSLPDIELSIKRHKAVNVLAQNLDGKKIKIRAKGYFARIIQHEIDHLEGVLITDRVEIKTDRIIFMGTGDFALPILERLIKSPFRPYLVVTEPDRPVGRGRKLTPSTVKLLAEKEKIKLWQPSRISQVAYRLSQLKPDLIIVAAYGQIISKEILDSAEYGALNIHPSLLPKYRGASPIPAVILNSDQTTGLTIIKMDEKMDHGPILAQIEVPLSQKETISTLMSKLAHLGAKLLINTIPKYLSKQIKAKVQNHDKATYTKLIKKEEARIDWNKKPQQIECQIRAFTPWPGSYTLIDGKRLKICQAHLENDKLIIDRVQLQGRKEMSLEEFKRGWKGPLDFSNKIR